MNRCADDGRLWRIWAITKYAVGAFDSALSAMEHASSLVPLAFDDHRLLANCYVRTGRLQHAKVVYSQLLEDPACPNELLAEISAGFGLVGDYRSALKVCRLASQREPARPEPLFGMVYYLRRLGCPAKVAIPMMTRAFQLDPNCSLYRSSLAFLLNEVGRGEEAYDLLREMPVREATCVCQVRRMMAIFQSAGDYECWRVCRQRLDQLS